MRNAFSSPDHSGKSSGSKSKSAHSQRAKSILRAAASFAPEALEGRRLLSTVILDATADTFVRGNSTSSTFGTSTATCGLPLSGNGCLSVQNDNGTNDGALSQITYLKFSPTGLVGTVNSAVLKLVGVVSGNPSTETRIDEVRGVPDSSWIESGAGYMTFATRKALDPGVLDSQSISGGTATALNTYRWNVASWLTTNPNQVVSFAVQMTTQGAERHLYRSREFGGSAATDAQKADRPKLVLSVGVPDRPATLTATPGNGSITLNWPVVDATSYTVMRGTSAGTETPYPPGTGITTNSFVDTGVTNGTDYFYTIVATNGSGDSLPSPEVTARPLVLPAPAPAPITVTEGIGTISLSWDAVPFADTYNVYRSAISGSGFVKVSNQQSGTTFFDTDVLQGQKFYYKISSVNSAGEGPLSPEIVATAGIVGNGTGLTGTFWDNIDYTGLSVSHVDPTVDFDYDACCVRPGPGGGSPDPAIGPETYSARWLGQVQAVYTQPYTFYTNSDDGVRLWVNNVLMTNAWVDRGAPATDDQSVAVNLVAGQTYDIRLDMYENGGASNVRLRWSSPSTSKEIIPMTQLIPDDGHPRLPVAPINLRTDVIDSSDICVHWTDASYDETNFVLQRSTNGDFPAASTITVPIPQGPNVRGCLDNGVTGGTAYFYRVKAQSALGDSPFTNNSTDLVSLVRTGNVITATTATPHRLSLGTSVFISGATPVGFNGQFAIASIPNATTFTFNSTGANDTATVPGKFISAVVPFGTPGPVNFPTFPASTSDLRLNRFASLVDGRLRLVEAVNDQLGSAWTTNVKFIDMFTANFDFQVTNSNGADGLTFTIQGNDTAAIGGGGGALGYAGMPNSVAIKIDFYPGLNQVGVYFNGAMNDTPGIAGPDGNYQLNTAPDVLSSGIDLDGLNKVYHMDVAYDGTTLLFTISDPADRTKLLSAQYTVDIPGIVGSPCAFVGFTAANGGLHSRQDILNFNYTSGAPVVNGTNLADTFYVRLDSPGGSHVHVWKNHDPATTPTPDYDMVKSAITNLALSGGRQTDTFTIDFSNGNPLPAGGLLLDGGQGNDTLIVKGTSAAESFSINGTQVTVPGGGTFRHTGMDFGSFNLGDNVAGDADDSLTITGAAGFSPVLNGGGGNNTLTVNAGAYVATADMLTGNNDGAGNSTINVVGAGTSTITSSNSQHLKSLTLNDTSKLILPPAGSKLLRTNGLSMAAGATLDVGDGDVIIQSSAAAKMALWNTIMGLLRSGRTGGAWTGPGIRSATAAALTTRATNVGVILNDNGSGGTILPAFNAEPVNANTILLKYTYYGDRDFDGDVDADDFAAVDAGFANRNDANYLSFPHQPSRDGDIDLNGAVDSDDYFAIDKAFNNQTGVLGGQAAPMPAASETTTVLSKAAAKKARHRRAVHHQRAGTMFRVRD
jgi:lectin family protein/PA14 domain-containing protein